MAINTYQTYLMYYTSSVSPAGYAKLIDIKDFPDLGGTPEMLETTTLSDPIQTFIKGIETIDSSGLQFTCNYTSADYKVLSDLGSVSNQKYAVWFGASTTDNTTFIPDGSKGKFSFEGQLSVYVNGGGVNEVVNMTVSIAPSTKITFSTPT